MDPKNIDRLFQEKLKDFELTPSPAVWNKIETSLVQTKKKKRAIVWFRFASVAAITLLGVFIYNNNATITSNENEIIEKTITNSESILAKPSPNLIKERLTKQLINTNKPITPAESVIVNSSETSKKGFQKSNIIIEPKEDLVIVTNEKSFSNEREKKSTKQTINNKEYIKPIPGIMVSIPEISKKAFEKPNITIESKHESIIAKNNEVGNDNSKIIFEETNNSIKFDSKTEDVALFKKSKALKEEKKLDLAKIIKEENQTPTTDDSKTIFEEINNSIEFNSKTDNIAFINKPKALKEEKKINLTKVTEEETKTQLKTTSWAIAPTVSQLFSNTLSNNSSIDSRLNEATKKGSNSTSFGLKIAYSTSKKWQFQTGIHQLELAQTTQSIQLTSTINASSISNRDFNSNFPETLSLDESNTKNSDELSTKEEEEGNINQTYGYIEVPLEVKYELMQSKKLEFHLIGGLSTLFLTKNNLQVESNTFSYSAGEANNLNKMNFTLNFGSNVEYHFHQKWYFDISPMIKFQTNTFDTRSNKPYFFGIYTGFNYKF